MSEAQPSKPGAVKVLLVDDHAVVRLGVKQALDKEALVQVIGTASSGKEAIEFVKENKPDVILLDYMMPDLDGIQTMIHLHDIDPDIKVIIFSGNAVKRNAGKALDEGAYGFISKSCEANELARAICLVDAGETYLEPDMAKLLATANEDSARFTALSDQELEIARLLASGESTGDISEILKLDSMVVFEARAKLLQKLGLKNTAGLVHFMLNRGEL
jgi:DNA-binding NarL/FixJ family response regulator